MEPDLRTHIKRNLELLDAQMEAAEVPEAKRKSISAKLEADAVACAKKHFPCKLK